MSFLTQESTRADDSAREDETVFTAGNGSSASAPSCESSLEIAAPDAHRLLLTLSHTAAFLFDPRTLAILEMNPAALALYGYTREESTRLTLRDLRPPQDWEALRRVLAGELLGVRTLGVWQHRGKDGRPLKVEITVSQARMGGREARLVVARDVAPVSGSDRRQSLLDHAPIAIVTIDEHGSILEFNPAAERMFGHAAAEIIGNELVETLIPHAMRARMRMGMAEYLATRERRMVGHTHELTALRADGTEVSVELTIVAEPGPAGAAFVGYFREITAERRTEAHLFAEFQVAQALATSSTFAEAAPRVLRALCECTGWDLGAVWRVPPVARALRLVDVWSAGGPEIDRFVAMMRSTAFQYGKGVPGRAWKSQETKWLGDLPHADPSLEHCHTAGRVGLRTVVAIPISFDGEVLAVIELFSKCARTADASFAELLESITAQIAQFLAREREHDRLRQANARFEALLEASPLGIFLFDVDMTVRYWSKAAERILGWKSYEMVGRSYLRVVPADHHAEHYRLRAGVLRGERFVGRHVVRQRKDGSLVNVVINGAPIRDSSGRITAMVGVIAEVWDPPQS